MNDRDQWQAEITHFRKQAVQRGLVARGAMDDGCSVACAGEAQAVKPVGLSGIKMSLEADFVHVSLVMIVSWSVCCSHCVPWLVLL